MDSGPLAEGLAIPAGVNYASMGGNHSAMGLPSTGPTLVAQKLLSTTWLWDDLGDLRGDEFS